MIFTPEFLHYFSASLTLVLGALGGGIGQGIAGLGVIESMGRQPAGEASNFRAMVIGLALIETGIILALVIALLLLFSSYGEITWAIALSELGIALALGTAAAAVSVASSFVVKASSKSIARQPFFAQKIITIMLLIQSIIEAPVIFAFIISLLIRSRIHESMTVLEGVRNLAAGMTIAFGSIGPSIGQAIFGYASCSSLGTHKNSYSKIFPFTLLNEVVIETPVIFCLLVSFMILYTPFEAVSGGDVVLQMTTLLVVPFVIGLGALGTSSGIGYTASRGCYQIAQEPENYSLIVRNTLLAGAFIETGIIYAMIIVFLLITRIS